MSRVHDALRRAEEVSAVTSPPIDGGRSSVQSAATAVLTHPLEGLLERIQTVSYRPSPDSLLIDPANPHEAPTEEFRTLRTRLNHMQSLQPIHTTVVTSPSPAEGKSFAAINLAMAEAQLAGNLTLLCDFDFRRPIVHNLFQCDRSPGITDYLQGKIQLHEAIRKIGDTNLYIMPAGEAVINPLELLNLKEVKQMLDRCPAFSTGSYWTAHPCCSPPTQTCFRRFVTAPSW